MKNKVKNALKGKKNGTKIMLCGVIIGFLVAVAGCERLKPVEDGNGGIETQVSNITFTGCDTGVHNAMEPLFHYVDVKFTSNGVLITHHNLVVNCAFDTVLVTQTFENGVLTITAQGEPNSANCVCITDVSYTISGISENEIDKIVINGTSVWASKSNCDKNVIISATEFENAPNDDVTIIDMKIVNNCLKIKFAAIECGTEPWIVELIGWGNYDKSSPPQTTLRLSLDNKIMCDALIVKEMEISFNLVPLTEYFKHHGTKEIVLNVSYNRGDTTLVKSILYKY
jgi:hypothetical protein